LFTEANWAATIGDIATFTYHYEESLTQIERALRTQYTSQAEPIADVIQGPVHTVAAVV